VQKKFSNIILNNYTCSDIDNLGGLPPAEAIILTFLAVAISPLLL
jgi:hypothetical protein